MLTRRFGRTGLEVPIIWWEDAASSVYREAIEHSGFVVARCPVENAELIFKTTAESILRREPVPVCRAILVEDATTEQLKAGRLFHRLLQLRDNNITQLFILEAPDALTAEWMVEHTPAHGVVLPFTLANQDIRYRVTQAAEEAQIALIARTDDLRLAIGVPAISAAIVPMPRTEVELTSVPNCLQESCDFAERSWQEYQTNHVEPRKPRSGHPPEIG